MLKKIRKGLAFTVVILITLPVVFIVEENIRGKAAWEKHLKELAAKGDSLDIKSIVPPPVPDDQNMAAAPIFAELMSTNQPDKIRLKKLLPDHLPSDLWDGWREGHRFDLAKLQTALTNETLAAMLNRWQPILQEAEVAMQRPQTRFPVRYEDGYAALVPHLNPLIKYQFVCSHCRYLIETAAKLADNMSDFLCLDCGSKFRRDLEKQEAVCPRRKCKSKNVVDVCQLEGKTCPSCKTGRFKGEGPRIS